MRLILAGGGDAVASRPLDRLFAAWTGKGRMLYLPVALDLEDYSGCRDWITSTFAPFGLHDIEMRTDLTPELIGSLGKFGSVYIGGGNTYRLLDLFRRTGFGRALCAYAEADGPVYGGSAGAIVLGQDIATCAHMDKNLVGLTDTRGLDLAIFHSAWCHYTPRDDAAIKAYCHTHSQPVLAIPETAGVVIERDSMTIIGTSPVILAGRKSLSEIKPGVTIDFDVQR